MAEKQPVLVCIDWGTTSLRAWKASADGFLLDERHFDLGILRVPDGDFAAAFEKVAGDWHREGLPVMMCGMIGSRQGWVEAPYVPCPADMAELSRHLVSPPGYDRVWIVPGLSLQDGDRRDVMRGEETQIAHDSHGATRVFVLPGTHSKWVRVENGYITDFRTYMTGELFDVLKRHSILGRLMVEGPFHEEGFRRGVLAARDGQMELPGALFSVRTLGLFGDLPPEALSDYLSGLLIGHEVREALRHFIDPDVVGIGSSGLIHRYLAALEAFGGHLDGLDEASAMTGLLEIAHTAGIIEGVEL